MCAFRDSMARLTDLHAQVIGISVNDPFSNKGFAEKNLSAFPNFKRLQTGSHQAVWVGAGEFRLVLKGYTVAKRSIFILDEEGIIRYMWVSDNPAVEPNYDEIQQALTEIS